MAAGVDTVHAACAFSHVDVPAKADTVATVEIHAFRLLCQLPVIIDIISTYIPHILWNNGDAHLCKKLFEFVVAHVHRPDQ
jgi:hypothetical protein